MDKNKFQLIKLDIFRARSFNSTNVETKNDIKHCLWAKIYVLFRVYKIIKEMLHHIKGLVLSFTLLLNSKESPSIKFMG